MRITATTRVGRLLAAHPEAVEALAWYGVELEDYPPGTTLGALCRDARLDLDDVLSDLEATLEEDEDEEEDSTGDLELPSDELEPEPWVEGDAWGSSPDPWDEGEPES